MAVSVDQQEALAYRKRYRGLIGVRSKVPLKDKSVLDLIGAAGVAETCSEIYRDPLKSFDYSCRGNTVAVVSDGSRVLGIGGIDPEAALPVLEGKAVILKTFAPDFPNQVENSLALPGIFRGALDVRARHINDQMKIAAAEAIAASVAPDALGPDHVLPGNMNYGVAPHVAAAVAKSAIETGEARVAVDPAVIEENTRRFVYEGRLYPYEENGRVEQDGE